MKFLKIFYFFENSLYGGGPIFYDFPLVLVSPVGGPHSLRGVGRGDGGGRGQWRREKNAQVPPMVEAKRGGGRGGGGVDSSPRPAVALIGGKHAPRKNAFEDPPPFCF